MNEATVSNDARHAGVAGIIATLLGGCAIAISGSPPDAASTIDQLPLKQGQKFHTDPHHGGNGNIGQNRQFVCGQLQAHANSSPRRC